MVEDYKCPLQNPLWILASMGLEILAWVASSGIFDSNATLTLKGAYLISVDAVSNLRGTRKEVTRILKQLGIVSKKTWNDADCPGKE